jgi:hypothetical protein
VTRVARASADGQYEVWLKVDQGNQRLVAGNTCKLKLKTMEKPDALTVPATAVATEGDKKVVHVLQNGKSTAREVQVGATSDGKTEILSGVSEGDRVLKTPPKAPAK